MECWTCPVRPNNQSPHLDLPTSGHTFILPFQNLELNRAENSLCFNSPLGTVLRVEQSKLIQPVYGRVRLSQIPRGFYSMADWSRSIYIKTIYENTNCISRYIFLTYMYGHPIIGFLPRVLLYTAYPIFPQLISSI